MMIKMFYGNGFFGCRYYLIINGNRYNLMVNAGGSLDDLNEAKDRARNILGFLNVPVGDSLDRCHWDGTM